jgi:hypothetical protein
MLKVNCEIKGLKELNAKIEYIKRLSQMKTDKEFQKFIQDKVLTTVKKITNERLIGGTTNDDAIEQYKNNHKIREENDGFILYNDTQIVANVNGVQNHIENYPNGMFPIALAFEYGVGIIGQNTPNNENAWAYNIQGYNFGWNLPKDVAEQNGIPLGQEYAGYTGFSIYHYTRIEVEKNLPKWVKEYFNGGASK